MDKDRLKRLWKYAAKREFHRNLCKMAIPKDEIDREYLERWWKSLEDKRIYVLLPVVFDTIMGMIPKAPCSIKGCAGKAVYVNGWRSEIFCKDHRKWAVAALMKDGEVRKLEGRGRDIEAMRKAMDYADLNQHANRGNSTERTKLKIAGRRKV